MDEGFELHERIYEIPNLLVRCVEDVCTILVYEYAPLLLAVDISARMIATIDYQHSLTCFVGTISDHSTEKSGTDNKQVVSRGFVHCFVSLCKVSKNTSQVVDKSTLVV